MAQHGYCRSTVFCLFVWVLLERAINLPFVIFTIMTSEMLINSNPSYCLSFPSKVLSKLNITWSTLIVTLNVGCFYEKPCDQRWEPSVLTGPGGHQLWAAMCEVVGQVLMIRCRFSFRKATRWSSPSTWKRTPESSRSCNGENSKHSPTPNSK